MDAVQPHRPIQQGDWVLVPPEIGDEEEENIEWTSSQVVLMYPMGVVDILIDDKAGGDIETLNVESVYLDEDKAGLPNFRLDWREK
jgi:hypothetical protein